MNQESEIVTSLKYSCIFYVFTVPGKNLQTYFYVTGAGMECSVVISNDGFYTDQMSAIYDHQKKNFRAAEMSYFINVGAFLTLPAGRELNIHVDRGVENYFDPNCGARCLLHKYLYTSTGEQV